jgi:two-component system phosphate regulon sensor histidine kinase PhoR
VVHLRDETEARKLEQMRVDFLANASHELRTPLASLSGFIETLKGHAKDDPAARDRFLGIMSAQADRMSRLISDLMSLSRIELNEHVPPAGAVDLASVVQDVADALAPIARDRSVRIETRLPPPGTSIVVGDRDQIVQVVQNLVDNALKYTPQGRAVEVDLIGEAGAEEAIAPHRPGSMSRLSLLTPDRAEDARYGVVRVRDFGPGIARQHLPRLTERFYRVEGQKSGDRLGTGLGLAIVKHIANRHRGGMHVESAPGEGTLFTVYFPKTPAPTRGPIQLHEAELAGTAHAAEPAAPRNKTVMQPS